MSIEELTVFLGWSTLINIGILLFSTLAVVCFKGAVMPIHGRMFSLKEEALPRMYFDYVGRYKALVIVFNLVPYLVLRLAM